MLNTTSTYVQSCVATEKAVTAAFMAHVAPALEREGIILQLEPNKRFDRQGIDAVMLYENRFEYIDFKNHQVPPERKGNCNYAFELESAHLDQPGARFPGWLVDEKKSAQFMPIFFGAGHRNE